MLNSLMRVGFGFFNVNFRQSRVLHSRVFSYPNVDTDDESTESCPHFTTLLNWQIFRTDIVFVRFYGLFRYFVSIYYSTRC